MIPSRAQSNPPPRGPVEPSEGLTARVFLATLGVSLGVFLAALDITIMGTAMPTIVGELGGFDLYSWAFSAYFLASIAATPLFGKLSDLYGLRRLFLIAIGIFLVSSALCGTARGMGELILFRAFQGVGGGSLLALGLTILGAMYPKGQVGRIQGIINAVWGVAAILGPLMGGYLVTHLSWRWVFYINLPSGVVATFLILSGLGAERAPVRRHLDLTGAMTLPIATVLLLLVLGHGKERPWGALDGGLLLLTAALIALFLWTERRAPEPLLPLSLFRDPTFLLASLIGLLSGVTLFSSTVFVPLFVQGVQGASALGAGRSLLPMSLAWVLSSFLGAGLLLGPFGERRLTALGFGLILLGYLVLTQVHGETSFPTLVLGMTLLGLGLGLVVPMLVSLVQRTVPREHLGVATSSTFFFRQLGGSLGIGILGGLMARGMVSEFSALSGPGGPSPALLAQMGNPRNLLRPDLLSLLPSSVLEGMKGALASSLARVFLIGFAVAAMGFLLTVFLNWDRGGMRPLPGEGHRRPVL